MWRLWMLFDPRRALIGVAIIGYAFVLLNHFVVLSSPRYGDFLGWGGQAQVGSAARPPAAR